MRKEVFEKLNQQDRIEYLIEKRWLDSGAVFAVVFMFFLVILFFVISNNQLIEGVDVAFINGIIVSLGILTIAIITIVGYEKECSKLDKKFFSKLDIKAKKDK